jgi:non-homologous end joining protein Ku
MSRAVNTLAEKSWDPSELSDPHEAIRQLAARKFKKGQDVIRSRAAARDEGGEIVDLMQVLRDSLAQNDLAAKNGRPRASTTARAGTPRKKKSGTSSSRRRTPSRAKAKPAARSKAAARRR